MFIWRIYLKHLSSYEAANVDIQTFFSHFRVRSFIFSSPYSYCAALNRSSCPKIFLKIGVPINFVKFIEENVCQSLIFNKVAIYLEVLLKHFNNPFSTNVSLLYLLKTSENLRFSGGTEVEHWLKMG